MPEQLVPLIQEPIASVGIVLNSREHQATSLARRIRQFRAGVGYRTHVAGQTHRCLGAFCWVVLPADADYP
jgi:hypothetical protein